MSPGPAPDPPGRLVVLGAGGHARVVTEAVRALGVWEPVGLLDPDPALKGESVGGLPVLGDDDLLAQLLHDGVRHFVCCIGSTGSTGLRLAVFERAVREGFAPVTVLHPRSIVSLSTVIGAGSVVLAGAVVNAGSTLGENVIVNTGAIVEHDCRVDAHAHVATGARLAGGVHIEAGAHVGVGATILQGIAVGAGAIVGAGAVVVRPVAPGETVVGVPARPMNPSRDE